MTADDEEMLELASNYLDVRFRDPGERRKKAIARLVESGFAPDSETACAISILLNYRPGESLVAPGISKTAVNSLRRRQQRTRVLNELQKLPDLPLSERNKLYSRLTLDSKSDPWLFRRVKRVEKLIHQLLPTVAPDDELRRLTLTPAEAVSKLPVPSQPEQTLFYRSNASPVLNPIENTYESVRTVLNSPIEDGGSKWVLILLGTILALARFASEPRSPRYTPPNPSPAPINWSPSSRVPSSSASPLELPGKNGLHNQRPSIPMGARRLPSQSTHSPWTPYAPGSPGRTPKSPGNRSGSPLSPSRSNHYAPLREGPVRSPSVPGIPR